MPELPEVETIVRELIEAKLIRSMIAQVEVFWAKIISNPSLKAFIENLQGQQILEIHRRGKYIVFQLDQGVLLVHLRMTGKLTIHARPELLRKHVHLRLHFEDGRVLEYEDQRKFGRWSYAAEPRLLHSLGLEPLSKEFTQIALKKLLTAHKVQIKPFLLNQHYIAGLGNIYVDEALWEAKIHPKTSADILTDGQIRLLRAAIVKVLKKGIANMGTSLGLHRGNYASVTGRRGGNQYLLNVFRQEGRACPRCGTAIIKTTIAQRGTHLCPHCQQFHR